jgi:hypothetical protein
MLAARHNINEVRFIGLRLLGISFDVAIDVAKSNVIGPLGTPEALRYPILGK